MCVCELVHERVFERVGARFCLVSSFFHQSRQFVARGFDALSPIKESFLGPLKKNEV